MIPKRIELENFLSFGKPAVAFTFTDDEPLWALCGKNGVGKSAVFDGITYALYGEHRGGPQKAEQLIRHGANGFRVVLEFAFGDGEYRITRVRAGRTAQKVERRIDGEWEAVPGVNSAADVKAWVEKTLGLGYKAFTSSVLLRQGEADKLFSASRDERIAVLKGIIGFERFEEISGRVHTATLGRGSTLDTLRRQLAALVPVTVEELAAGEAAVTAAERTRDDAQAALTAAARRVEQAKQWEGLETRRGGLERQLAAAGQRAADAATIRAAKARLDDLAAAVPELEAVVKARGLITGLEGRLNDARNTIDVCELARAVAGEEQLLAQVEAVECLEDQLKPFPPDLDHQHQQALEDEEVAEKAWLAAHGARIRAETRRDQARGSRQQFAEVAVGVSCSRCGQIVDPVHAEKERAQLARDVRSRESEFDDADEACRQASENRDARKKSRLDLEQRQRERNELTNLRDRKREALCDHRDVTSAREIRDRLGALRKQLADKGGLQGNAIPNRLDGTIDRLRNEMHGLENERSRRQGQREAAEARLSETWRSQLPALGDRDVTGLIAERDRLQASGVATRFDLLRQDDEKRSEWSGQLQVVRTEIERIPTEARIPATEAERRQGEAKSQWDAANTARDTAVRTRDGLRSRAEQYQSLTARLRTAEREHDLHKKLDALLGQNGLQRELVRDAEQQIVGLANDTLQHLSDGDLSVEQDDEAARRDDKAFALRVRRAGDPLPIGVLFLSGSQKFRVAVSVALAVGRFASGRARPLEAVIIDEGFGSLDKDGLRAMADELKRLQRSQSLKRVILVSHQDEFTEQFPVGYRLSPADSGTTAVPFRR